MFVKKTPLKWDTKVEWITETGRLTPNTFALKRKKNDSKWSSIYLSLLKCDNLTWKILIGMGK